MFRRPKMLVLTALFLLLMVPAVACDFSGGLLGATPTAIYNFSPDELMPQSPTPTPESILPVSPTPEPVETTPLEPEPPAEDTPEDSAAFAECTEEVCIYDHPFVLDRPLESGGRDEIDPTVRFGTYQRTLKSARHNVQFVSSTGTPVLAAADGTVVLAGDDTRTAQALFRNYYGSLVILEHNIPEFSQPVFTLYAHLSEVLVDEGDVIEAGDEVGLVGSTGDVNGSTLRFEVRFGDNVYDAARNPELWLSALPDDTGSLQGALAGRVVNPAGEYLFVDNIVLERLGGRGQPALDTYYIKTYAEDRLVGTEPWFENFAISDLPAGSYQITFYFDQELIQREVEVESGKLTLVTIAVP
jgi:hypothetical protein